MLRVASREGRTNMIPVDQTTFEVPGGNCFSACVATLLDLSVDDVPYFMGFESFDQPNDWFEKFQVWLYKKGLWAVAFEVDPKDGGWEPKGLCILSGKSPRGDYLHSVVAMGYCILHDPHPSRAGLMSKHDVTLLVPIDPSGWGQRKT